MLGLLPGSSGVSAAPRVRRCVLLVEDEEAIRDLVQFHLDLAGLETVVAVDGTQALRLVRERVFDAVILDLLPGLDGISVCQAIRREGPNHDVPILMLTARAEESDRVVGLESGADDYLIKPFGVRELVARVRALLRRRRGFATPARRLPVMTTAGISIDPTRREVTCDGTVVSLTPQEFRLLYLLASNPGVVFDREELMVRVWPADVFVTSRESTCWCCDSGERSKTILQTPGASSLFAGQATGSRMSEKA